MAPFVQTLTEDVLAPLVAEEEEASTHYMFGLDVVSWISGAAARSAVPYLASVLISFPLIGLTQLVQYLSVALRSWCGLWDLSSILTAMKGSRISYSKGCNLLI